MNAPKKPQGRGLTVVWALIGLLCSAGVILAAVDPGLTGSSSGSSLDPAPAPSGDDGFVAPPAAKTPAKAPAKAETLDPSTEAARNAHADELIQKLITKMRKEREAVRAARKLAQK